MLNKLSQTFNRALIKRVDLLPNVSEFVTHRLGIHEYAAVYGIEKVRRSIKVEKLVKGTANRYLERQAVRLTKFAYYNQVSEYNKLSELIQRKSIAFRVLALNRTMETWFTMPIKKLDKLWRSLSSIARNNSADLKFKRVWIDKKPGDYARPLGVPTPAWRCWSYMKMDHLERFYKASGQLATWQHGGRSGVGVLSCYKQLIPKMIAENTIYEFDIKGFFDNISHERIIQKIKETMGIEQSEWIEKILKATPMKYQLPPKEKDTAFLRNEEIVEASQEPYHLPEYVSESDNSSIEAFDYIESHLDENLTIEEIMANFHKEKEAREDMLSSNRYAHLMTGDSVMNAFEFFESESFKEEEREKGRDQWKNLGQPGKGVPQGLGTSPFLSTLMTDMSMSELKDNIIMYMDDGILFAQNKAEMEKTIQLLKDCLEYLGLEIAPEKSGYIKEEGTWTKSSKFLGLRFLPEENTIMSDTRSGTQVKFPMKADWDDVKTLAVLNHSSVSNIKEKFDRLVNTTAYEAGLKYGFLGCLIAGSQYKESKTLDERREDIRAGQAKAWAEMEKSKGFIWKFQDLQHYTGYLTNMSSIQVHKFMELNRKRGKLYHYQGRRKREELMK